MMYRALLSEGQEDLCQSSHVSQSWKTTSSSICYIISKLDYWQLNKQLVTPQSQLPIKPDQEIQSTPTFIIPLSQLFGLAKSFNQLLHTLAISFHLPFLPSTPFSSFLSSLILFFLRSFIHSLTHSFHWPLLSTILVPFTLQYLWPLAWRAVSRGGRWGRRWSWSRRCRSQRLPASARGSAGSAGRPDPSASAPAGPPVAMHARLPTHTEHTHTKQCSQEKQSTYSKMFAYALTHIHTRAWH